MKKIEKWVTSDGFEHDLEADARAHEDSLKAIEGVERYLEESGVSGKKLAEYKRVIANWERHKAAGITNEADGKEY